MIEMEELIPVDYELINRLKREGKGYEARKLLRAFRKSVEEEKKQVYKEETNKERKIRKILGMCTRIGCKREAMEGKVQCEICAKSDREYKKRASKTLRRKESI